MTGKVWDVALCKGNGLKQSYKVCECRQLTYSLEEKRSGVDSTVRCREEMCLKQCRPLSS